MDRSTWLEERKKGITSTDASAIAGLNPWKTPLAVYLEKLGLVDPKPPTKQMLAGLRMEPVIAGLYEEETGQKLNAPNPFELVVRPDFPWLRTSLDRLLPEKNKIVELKNVAQKTNDWGEPGTDEIPTYYIMQCQHQIMACQYLLTMPIQEVDVAVLFAGWDFQVYHIRRNQEYQDVLFSLEEGFWERVQQKNPPALRENEVPEALNRLLKVEEKMVELPETYEELVRDYQYLGEEEKEIQKSREEIRGKLLFALMEAQRGRLPSGIELIRSVVKRKEYTVPASEYLTLRIKEPKNGNSSSDRKRPRGSGGAAG
jgi:putative phage-type endonuclease